MHSILKGTETIVMAKNKEVINKILKGIEKYYKPGESKTGMREGREWKAVYNENGRNMRTVWNIATKGIKEGHFAIFPEELVRRCLVSGCPEDGIVLDPFLGSGTTLKVAKSLNMHGIGIELKREYIDIAVGRIGEDLFTKIDVEYNCKGVYKLY